MRLTQQELELVRNHLLAKKAYRDTAVPGGAVVWEPFMQTLLTKINDELQVLT